MPDEFKKTIEREMWICFGRKLHDDVELDDDAWEIIDELVEYTLGDEFDDRLQAKGQTAREWWESPKGAKYACLAAGRFAKRINAKGDHPTARQIRAAYGEAKAQMHKTLLNAFKRDGIELELMSPILCEAITT